MSAQVTEAHRKLVAAIIRDLSIDDGAQLIADSEAKATAELRGALALGQQNCDDVYDDLRTERDNLRAERDSIKQEIEMVEHRAYRAEVERDQLRAEVERWELAFQEQYARAESAEREVERLNGCCEELHTIIDNHGYPSGVDYAKMEARASRAEAEVERLGHLEAVLRSSAADMTAGSITAGGVADLRAENERLRRAYVRPDDIRAQLESAIARAERAEAELATCRESLHLADGTANLALVHRDAAEAELAGIRALADRRNKRCHVEDTTHQLVAALDQALDIAQAELAAERARLADLVADLNDACITLESAENDCDDYAMQNTAFKLMAVRNVLLQYIPNAAMKGGAK